MDLLVLGSGGNTPIPTPTCHCRVCEQARREGIPYSRGGNSLYFPGIATMVDAPEFTFRALNREGITDLDRILLTHWHPDHVNGLRVVQSRDLTAHEGLLDAVADGGPTLVTTRAVWDRVCDVFGQVEHFTASVPFADVRFLDDDPLRVGDTTISAIPYPLEADEEEPDATGFLLEQGDTTVLVASDDARHFPEHEIPAGVDLAVFECGLFEEGPDGESLMTERDWEFLAHELTHEEVLERIDRVEPDRTLLTEIEHLTARSHDHFRELAAGPAYDGIGFAHDGLELEI